MQFREMNHGLDMEDAYMLDRQRTDSIMAERPDLNLSDMRISYSLTGEQHESHII